MVAVGKPVPGIDEIVKVTSYPPEENLLRVENLSGFWNLVQLTVKLVSPGKYQLVDYKPPCN